MEPVFQYAYPKKIRITNSKGSYLIANKKKYLDFMMGWCVGNVGWNNNIIKNAVKKFNGPTYVSPYYEYDQWNKLGKKLISLMPNKNYTCFRATGGTEAVEIALKTSRAYNKRKKFMAFKSAYHGQSLACLELVGISEHVKHFGLISRNIRLDAKNWEKTTKIAVKHIKSRKVSAFIAEPIICNLGVVIPPKSFFEEVYDACKKTDTVFIADEVAAGFGRTGKWFSFEHFNLKPDMVIMAKGFSSGYGSIGSTIISNKIAESMRFSFSNYSTFGWLPISVEAALANIDYMKKKKLVKQSEKNGAYLIKELSEFCKPEGKGLCVGFDTKSPNYRKDCFKDDLIISDTGARNSYIYKSRAILFPALDASKKELDKGIEILKKNF